MDKIKKNTYLYFFTTSYASGKKKIIFFRKEKSFFLLLWGRKKNWKEWKIVFIFINAFRNFIYMNFFFGWVISREMAWFFFFCLCPFLECWNVVLQAFWNYFNVTIVKKIFLYSCILSLWNLLTCRSLMSKVHYRKFSCLFVCFLCSLLLLLLLLFLLRGNGMFVCFYVHYYCFFFKWHFSFLSNSYNILSWNVEMWFYRKIFFCTLAFCLLTCRSLMFKVHYRKFACLLM